MLKDVFNNVFENKLRQNRMEPQTIKKHAFHTYNINSLGLK